MAEDLHQPREQASFGEQALLSQAIGIVSRTIDQKPSGKTGDGKCGNQIVKSNVPLSFFSDGKVLFFVLEILDTGTVVMFFFTRNTDLFFAQALLAARRNLFGGDRDRRVLTFPSGFGLGLDLNLFVGFGFGNGLSMGLGFPICRWEDAEGNGDASLKVQICDFCWRERSFSFNLPKFEGLTRSSLALVPTKQKSKRMEKNREMASEGLRSFFSSCLDEVVF
jgi:hypothetical protein